MKVAIMQPYFFPYIGYFQLISAVDLFIVYDNIKYSKKGWINRNRMLQNGKAVTFSLPLRGDSDFLDVRDRELAAEFRTDQLLNRIKGAYFRAPYFKEAFRVIEQVMQYSDHNLFRFLHNSILRTCEYLRIGTEIAISSGIHIDHRLKNQDKVIALCEQAGADVYINAIGGTELYSKEAFQSKGMNIKFIKTMPFEYKQFDGQFVTSLSIIDVMMFNSVDTISERLVSNYELM
jgi:hypothetical protein